MARIIVLGAAGIIGQAIAQDLVEDVAEIIVADLDLETAQKLADRLGPGCVAKYVDVTKPELLDEVLKDADACINSAQYYFNLQVMQGCLRNRVPYLDLGGLFFTTREQLKLAQDFEEAGITAILGLGSCPGVANVQAGYLAEKLDTVESVKIYNGSTIDEGESLSWAYSIETILDEISKPAMIFRDGQFQEMAPISEEEYFLFPDPIGYAKTHLSLHSEVATIPLTLADKGIQECFFKITFFGYSESALRKMQFLTELGLADKEPLAVKGGSVAPRDVLIALLNKAPAAKTPPVNLGYKDIATVVTGTQGESRVALRMDTWAWPHEGWEMSGSKLMVASPPAVVARWLADGRLQRPGVWAPEQVVEGDRFFADLSQRGVGSSIDRQEILHGIPEN
jgi:saccharopine dehydrogenase-like NADP-dependent oxidoreductase